MTGQTLGAPGPDSTGLVFSDDFSGDLSRYTLVGTSQLGTSGGRLSTTSGAAADRYCVLNGLARADYLCQCKFIAGSIPGSGVRRVGLTVREWADNSDRVTAFVAQGTGTAEYWIVGAGPTGIGFISLTGQASLTAGSTYWLRFSAISYQFELTIYSTDPEATTAAPSPAIQVDLIGTGTILNTAANHRYGPTVHGAPGMLLNSASADASAWQIDEFKVWIP